MQESLGHLLARALTGFLLGILGGLLTLFFFSLLGFPFRFSGSPLLVWPFAVFCAPIAGACVGLFLGASSRGSIQTGMLLGLFTGGIAGGSMVLSDLNVSSHPNWFMSFFSGLIYAAPFNGVAGSLTMYYFSKRLLQQHGIIDLSGTTLLGRALFYSIVGALALVLTLFVFSADAQATRQSSMVYTCPETT
jgi:hypothetical protein